MKTQQDPTPEEIRLACLEIQSTWTPVEKLRRLRVDQRPVVCGADGRLWDVSVSDYHEHCETNATHQLQRDAMHRAGER